MAKKNNIIAFRRFRDIASILSKIGQTRNWHVSFYNLLARHVSFYNLLAIIDIVDISQYNRQALD